MGAEEEGSDEQQHQKVPVSNRPPPMKAAQFLAWKTHKDADINARKAEVAQKRAQDIAAGVVPMNGRELFLHEPWVFDNYRY